MPKVYVINRSGHNFADAKRFGSLVYLSDESYSPFATNQIARTLWQELKYSQPEDYLLLTGLSVMQSIACTIFGIMHKRLNLLIYRNQGKTGAYIAKSIYFDSFMDNPEYERLTKEVEEEVEEEGGKGGNK